jgi:hypothetical protein
MPRYKLEGSIGLLPPKKRHVSVRSSKDRPSGWVSLHFVSNACRDWQVIGHVLFTRPLEKHRTEWHYF